VNLPFDTWLPQQRWYAGRGRQLSAVRAEHVVALAPDLELALLDAEYTDESAEQYQVLVRWGSGDAAARIGYDADPERVGYDADAERVGYDAMADPAAAGVLLELIASSASVGPVSFVREPGAELPADRAGRRLGAEQSNTSVVFGDRAILKVFRRVIPGINPDIELTRALTGNPHVTPLLGSYELAAGGEPYALGMLTTFAAGSTDGWDLALAAADKGTDFTAESHRLGEAVGTVHTALAATLGTEAAAFPVDTWIRRLHATAATVPQLRDVVPRIEARYRALTDATSTVQRIHGDLHLGQVLRTPTTWLIIDFEGEPGQPLAERRRRDDALRDIAGMLRSYDYAARGARDWVDTQCAAFCAGYATVTGTDPREQAAVLAAYELDKAVYEVGYEARYRPDWLPIPLGAVTRLAAG
jgi:maltokinase